MAMWEEMYGRWMGHRMMERGNVKFVILDMLQEKPRHGYEIIRSLEEKFGGRYTPSPGVIYPTLQMLEDQGYVRSTQQDGRRVYELTEEGRKFLDANREKVDNMKQRHERWSESSFRAEAEPFISEVRELMHLLAHGGRTVWSDPEKRRRIREVLERTRRDISAILSE